MASSETGSLISFFVTGLAKSRATLGKEFDAVNFRHFKDSAISI